MNENNKDVRSKLFNMFYPMDHDWMNYVILDDILTFHHIIKEEDGGNYVVDNGAILTQRAHTYLHYIEKIDKDIFNEINIVLKRINESRQEPSYNDRLKIELLLYEFELKNCDRIIKKKEKIKKNDRAKVATLRRIRSQLGENI